MKLATFTADPGSVALGAVIADGQENRGKRSQAVPGKDPPHPPAVGKDAPDFQLKNLNDELVSLNKLTAEHNVVLVVLRGWPGYQCPICSRQVGEFLTKGRVQESRCRSRHDLPGPSRAFG